MSQSLSPGGNAPIDAQSVVLSIDAGAEVDVSCFRLYENGKTQIDEDFVFYGQTSNDDGTVSLVQTGNVSTFNVSLSGIKNNVQKLAFCAVVDKGTIASVGRIRLSVSSDGDELINCDVSLQDRSEKALILGELYKRNDQWKFKLIAQGFNGGLQPLAEHFGVDIVDEPAQAPQPQPAPEEKTTTVNLSKVSLTKASPTISLEKAPQGFGAIKVNLNWIQKTKGSWFGGNKNIDLDLGAFIRLSGGQQTVVQALGEMFGSLEHEPFIHLLGDDRTGAVTDGEWIHINGDKWSSISEILIYAFIYEGAPNWTVTDGVVTIYTPNQGPIETKLTDGSNGHPMCAIARFINDNGNFKVERLNTYHVNHRDLDQHYKWGFPWEAGSK